MIALIKFLITGKWECHHEWETKETHKTNVWDGEIKRNLPIGYELSKFCQCKKCGAWKSFKMKY